jgi:MFS family permease
MNNINYKNKVAIVYLLGFFLDLVNVYIAVIGFPIMGKMLHATIGQLSWVANIYSLGLALVQ